MSSFYGSGSKPWVHSNCAGDLRELLRVPLRIRDTVELGRVSRDSTGFRAMEEVLISSGGRNLSGVPRDASQLHSIPDFSEAP